MNAPLEFQPPPGLSGESAAFSQRALVFCAKIFPRAAAPWLSRFFTTPPRFETPAHEIEFLRSGERLEIPFADDRLAAWRWGGKDPSRTVLLTHGWGGRGGQLASFVGPLRAAGFSVVLFDSPAHGLSGGSEATVVDFEKAIQAVARAQGPMHAVIAHSMGAAGAALAIAHGLPLGCAVFVGSPVSPEKYTRFIGRRLGLPDRSVAAVKRYLERRDHVRWGDLSIPAMAPSLRTPLLLAHDREDRDTAWEGAAKIARAWPGAQLLTTEGLGHRKILRDPEVIAKIVRFIDSDGQARVV